MKVARTPLPLQAESISRLQLSTVVKTVDPLSNSSEWDNLVLAQPTGTIFHSSAWAKVLSKTYGHRPFYLHFSNATGWVGLIPLMEVRSAITGRRGVSLPFSDSCAPLGFNVHGLNVAQEQTLRIAQERRWRYFELRVETNSCRRQLFRQQPSTGIPYL